MDKDLKSENQQVVLNAACCILEIDLKGLVDTEGATSASKMENRFKILNAPFRKTHLRWHPDKNLEAEKEIAEKYLYLFSSGDIIKL